MFCLGFLWYWVALGNWLWMSYIFFLFCHVSDHSMSWLYTQFISSCFHLIHMYLKIFGGCNIFCILFNQPRCRFTISKINALSNHIIPIEQHYYIFVLNSVVMSISLLATRKSINKKKSCLDFIFSEKRLFSNCYSL